MSAFHKEPIHKVEVVIVAVLLLFGSVTYLVAIAYLIPMKA